MPDSNRRDLYQQSLCELSGARKKLGNLVSMDRPTRSQVAEETGYRETIKRISEELKEEGVLDDQGHLTPAALALDLQVI